LAGVHDDKGVRLADREIWLDRSLDGTTGLRVGGLPGTFRFLAPSAFGYEPVEFQRRVRCVAQWTTLIQSRIGLPRCSGSQIPLDLAPKDP